MITALQIFAGFVLLIVGAEVLVRGASRLASLLGMTPLVIGLTVVAFGTSSPELAVSIQSVLSGSSNLAVGNAVGSNTLNILLILGISAVIIPLSVKSQVVKFDVPVMVTATIALLMLSLDGQISRIEGIAMVLALLIYISILICIALKETRRDKQLQLAESGNTDLSDAGSTSPSTWFMLFGQVVAGLLILGIGCRLFVSGSVELARIIGVSELVIGLTVVSIGTSLPELMTTIIACFRKERDMAIGNIVGSNIFNILCVLGVTASVAPDSIPVAQQAINFDIPVTLAAAAICLPIFFTGMQISRWEGVLMLVLYAGYLTWLLWSSYNQPSTDTLTNIMWYGVVPVTIVMLVGSVLWSMKKPLSTGS